MQRRIYWSHTVSDVYITVSNYSVCARNRVEPKLKRQLKLFSVSDWHEFIDINIFGPLLHTANDERYVSVVTNKYPKLARALTTGKTFYAHVANVSYDFG